ncbi:MAG: hypothetical protein C0594_15820 [Marinilabiliales bacterium]|nr:MAG: hypothetical protein C0594_15820 [Marinilabiliales bacterium]
MGLIILSISAIGQYSSIYKNTSFFKKGRLLDESTVKNIKNLSSSGDTIWFENFSSGVMPAGWTEMDNTGNDFNGLCTDQDPTGQYTSESAIASTSGGHFMLLNGDNYNTPLPATPVEMDAYFQTDAIDCSQSSSVVLRFQQYYRVCCNSWVADGGTMILSVYVSTDGVNWTEFDTHGQPTQNSSGYMSENYDQVEVNISSVAAQSASVYLRFHKKGASHYFWMIDDIVLMEAKEHDLVMEKGFANYHFIDGGYYTQIPSVQASSYWFSGLVYNNGAQDETNTSMLVNVNDGTSDVFTETADTSIFGSDGRDTLELDNYFELNQSATSYSVDMSIGSDNTDEDSTNNKISFDFAVSDTVFAHDISANSFISPSLYNSGSDGDLIGCQYWFNTDDTLGSVSVYIDSRSSENTSIRAEVYKYDSNLGELLLAIDSEEHIISTEDLGSWVTLPLTSEDGLQEYANADVMYYAMISCTWGNDTLWIG